MNKVNENNKVDLSGIIASEFSFSHEVCGEGFYMVYLKIKRRSEATDVIPLLVSERLADVTQNCIGAEVEVFGQLRSFNKHVNGRNRLILSVFVTDIFPIDRAEEDNNSIILNGFICKKPVYRETPSGIRITDILLAVNRAYGKSDYIPCITWGRTAGFASRLEVGTYINIKGRIQSREYQKRLNDDESETRVAYEVSTNILRIPEREAIE